MDRPGKRIVKRNQPCRTCASSDAMQIWEDGSAYCFSCKSFFRSVQEEQEPVVNDFKKIDFDPEDYSELGSAHWVERKLPKQVLDFYRVKFSYDEQGNKKEVYFPGCKTDSTITGYKVRNLADKKNMKIVGKVSRLFGLEHFRNGGKRIIITEGEPDCLAVAAALWNRYKTFYPVVSMGGATALGQLKADREVLRNYEEIVLWFDNDEPGRQAVEEAAKILGFDKVKVVRAAEKDANDLLMNLGFEAGCKKILTYVWDAGVYSPTGILTKEQVWAQLLEYQELESIPYPPQFEELNSLVRGVRQGEITMFAAGSSVGKSSLVRVIAANLLLNHKLPVGLVMLEENPAETAKKMAGLALGLNLAEEEVSQEELRRGFDIIFQDDLLKIVDHAGSSSDTTILDLIEYLAILGCKHIILDHVTLLVSEGYGALSGNEATDKVMNELKRIATRHNCWIGVISHLRKVSGGATSFEEGGIPSMDDLKGSGSLKQISNDIIVFSRDSQHENEELRNIARVRVLKCRFTGRVGPAGYLRYNRKTGNFDKVDSDFVKTIEKAPDNFEMIE